MSGYSKKGFTLIELSIVLVIVGLLVGGVLVGKDLIRAATIRSVITQIQKYNEAVNTFRSKYNGLPGDLDASDATYFGFVPRGQDSSGNVIGAGEGNNLIDGFISSVSSKGYAIGAGEPITFWNDLSYANGMNINLIEGSFNAGTTSCYSACGNVASVSPTLLAQWIPQAKIGGGNFVYVYSGSSMNYFGISVISSMTYWSATSAPGITVVDAYSIDAKIDDGYPQTGRVITQYINSTPVWAIGGGGNGVNPGSAASASSNSCYDNGGNASNLTTYSLSVNNGLGVNCALSFRLQ